MERAKQTLDRLAAKYPFLPKLSPLWKLAEVVDTLRGYAELVPRPVRTVLTWAFWSLLSAFGGTKLFLWAVNQVPSVHVPSSWPVAIPIAVGFGLSAWAIVVVRQSRHYVRSQNEAYETAAAQQDGGAMESHGDDPADDREETAATSAEEATSGASSEVRPGYVKRFGMLWFMRHIPRKLTPVEALTTGITGILSKPTFLRVEGPFCPNDYGHLQCKDRNGYRHMSDGDDVNLNGSPYCPKCGFNERPDPNYHAARLLGTYRQMVKEDYPYAE